MFVSTSTHQTDLTIVFMNLWVPLVGAPKGNQSFIKLESVGVFM